MKMATAIEIMNEKRKKKTAGFMVDFEHAGDGFLRSDHFPDKQAGEPLIETEDKAWELAKNFAAKTKGVCVNIYVTDGDFNPVQGYKKREIKNR